MDRGITIGSVISIGVTVLRAAARTIGLLDTNQPAAPVFLENRRHCQGAGADSGFDWR
jgi:hypothetical protein